MAKYITKKTLKNVRSGMTIYQFIPFLDTILVLKPVGKLHTMQLRNGLARSWKRTGVVTSSGNFFWRHKDALAEASKRANGK